MRLLTSKGAADDDEEGRENKPALTSAATATMLTGSMHIAQSQGPLANDDEMTSTMLRRK